MDILWPEVVHNLLDDIPDQHKHEKSNTIMYAIEYLYGSTCKDVDSFKRALNTFIKTNFILIKEQ